MLLYYLLIISGLLPNLNVKKEETIVPFKQQVGKQTNWPLV